MNCRPGCGACCIAMSISSPLPGMPDGKPSGVPCIHLTDDYRCALFGDSRRPRVCADIAARPDMCGSNRKEALELIYAMEEETKPG